MLMYNNSYVEALSENHAGKEEALNYIDSITHLIKSVDEWRIDAELQMFLDQRSTPVSMLAAPREFTIFYEEWQGDLHHASATAGFVEHVDFRSIRALARALATSFTRRRYYVDTLENYRARIESGKDCKLPALHDLELRYQYHLYVMDHEDIGVPIDKDFGAWCDSDECRTFFDVLELSPKSA